MIWHDASIIIIFAFSSIMGLLFLRLYLTNEKPESLLIWAAAWGAYCTSVILLISGIEHVNLAPVFLPVSEIFAMINCALLLYGIHSYYRKRMNPVWFAFFSIACLWIIISQYIETGFKIKILPPAIFFFTAYSFAGFLFISGIKKLKMERIIAGILLLLWGTGRLIVPFNIPDESSMIYYIVPDAFLNIMISIFTILAYLQETRQQFISEKIKAVEADRLKSSFLANMSHEIRTPLNAILGFTDLLAKPDLSHDDKDIFIKNIKMSGEKLLSLLEDILDLSRIEAGVIKVYIDEVSINKLIDDLAAVISLSRRVIEKQLKLEVRKGIPDGKDIIHTDETRLFQILSNLLNNAVKFTEHGTITIGYELPAHDYIRFFVKDTGIGISEESIQKIFTPFFQEGKIPAAGGTGLGLPIVKGLAESLGGTIEITSIVNSGTEVSFTMPYIRSEEPEQEDSFPDSPDSYNITGKKILLVEDEPVNRRLMEKFIEATGAELISTESGYESVELCARDMEIDLVLMDLTLPDIDGYSAIKEIKKTRPDLPIITQSATSMPEHREKARDAGSDFFIAKPIKKEELYNSIRKLLYRKEGN